MSDNNHKLNTYLYDKIKNINNVKILEFGVREGVSTQIHGILYTQEMIILN